MTNQEGVPLPSAPLFYWTSRGMANFRGSTVKRLLAGIDHACDDFELGLNYRQKGLGLIKNPDPKERLMAYYNKPDTWEEANMLVQEGLLKVPYSWESQKAYFPNDWAEDWTDFQSLRVRAANGDFGPELQVQEEVYAAGEGEDVPPDSALVPGMPQEAPNGMG